MNEKRLKNGSKTIFLNGFSEEEYKAIKSYLLEINCNAYIFKGNGIFRGVLENKLPVCEINMLTDESYFFKGEETANECGIIWHRISEENNFKDRMFALYVTVDSYENKDIPKLQEIFDNIKNYFKSV